MCLFSLKKGDPTAACSYLLGGYREGAASLLRGTQRRMGGSAQRIPMQCKEKLLL